VRGRAVGAGGGCGPEGELDRGEGEGVEGVPGEEVVAEGAVDSHDFAMALPHAMGVALEETGEAVEDEEEVARR
jgi:hypothetical protein